MSSTGPSIRSVCRILNQNSCGSGSICGILPDGSGSYVMTNAHVAGTDRRRRIVIESEHLNGQRFEGRVVRAAYSNSASADWSLLEVPGLLGIDPVYLARDLPKDGESMYTKGFPRCTAHSGTDIKQVRVMNNGVLLWLPDAISGQSGSGVWSDIDNEMKALLAWSIRISGRSYGAGQLTAEIFRQNRDYQLNRAVRFSPRIPGAEYQELNDFDLDFDRSELDDPTVEEGIFSDPLERNSIQDFPIWSFMFDQPENPDPEPNPGTSNKVAIQELKRVQDGIEKRIAELENEETTIVDPADPDTDSTFGL